jgi:ribosomal-protein-alanine N-acetyltransferase
MKVESARPEDLEPLAELFELLHPGAFDLEILRQQWALPGTSALVVWLEGRLMAGLLLRQVLDEAEVLVVGCRVSRRGYGTRLLEALRAECMAQGVARIFLEVAEDNHPAIALYSKAGFGRVGRRRGYYRSGADALLYALSLR